MTARVSRNFKFNAGIHFENSFSINEYSIKLYMEVMTENIEAQNIALERIKYLFEDCLSNSLLINIHEDNNTIENYVKAGLKICTLPEDPYDQVVAAVIMKKINSILENRMYVTEIRILSQICDGVEFYIGQDEEVDIFSMTENWWCSPSTRTSDWGKKSTKKEKIVELKKETIDWADLSLEWAEKPKKKKDQEVVYINLDK